MQTETESINIYDATHYAQKVGVPVGNLSDGYHTFNELYEHRIVLYMILCAIVAEINPEKVWKAKKHHDDSEFEGCFIMGINTKPGFQISCHLPLSKWDECKFATEREKAPEWDGHTSADVLERLKKVI